MKNQNLLYKQKYDKFTYIYSELCYIKEKKLNNLSNYSDDKLILRMVQLTIKKFKL